MIVAYLKTHALNDTYINLTSILSCKELLVVLINNVQPDYIFLWKYNTLQWCNVEFVSSIYKQCAGALAVYIVNINFASGKEYVIC